MPGGRIELGVSSCPAEALQRSHAVWGCPARPEPSAGSDHVLAGRGTPGLAAARRALSVQPVLLSPVREGRFHHVLLAWSD